MFECLSEFKFRFEFICLEFELELALERKRKPKTQNPNSNPKPSPKFPNPAGSPPLFPFPLSPSPPAARTTSPARPTSPPRPPARASPAFLTPLGPLPPPFSPWPAQLIPTRRSPALAPARLGAPTSDPARCTGLPQTPHWPARTSSPPHPLPGRPHWQVLLPRTALAAQRPRPSPANHGGVTIERDPPGSPPASILAPPAASLHPIHSPRRPQTLAASFPRSVRAELPAPPRPQSSAAP